MKKLLIALALVMAMGVSGLAEVRHLQNITVKAGASTGVHINNREILTAAHVIKPWMENAIWIVNGEHEMLATLKKIDRELDLALLEVDEYIQFGELRLQVDAEVGDDVIIVGNPGKYEDVIVWGRISAKSENHLIIDITIIPGMSGGGLFRGEDLLGIVSQMYGSSQGSDWLALIIPSEKIIKFLEE